MPKKVLTEEEKVERMLARALMRLWSRWPERKAVLLAARREYHGPNKKLKWEYRCAICGNYFKGGRGGDIEVDHIIPKGSYVGDLWGWASRLFCSRDNLQVLCKFDHYKKSALEGEARRQINKNIPKTTVKGPRMRKRVNG